MVTSQLSLKLLKSVQQRERVCCYVILFYLSSPIRGGEHGNMSLRLISTFNQSWQTYYCSQSLAILFVAPPFTRAQQHICVYFLTTVIGGFGGRL